MVLFSCFVCPIISSSSKVSSYVDNRNLVHAHHHKGRLNLRPILSIQGLGSKTFDHQVLKLEAGINLHGSFLRGTGIINRPQVGKFNISSKRSGVCYSWLNNTQIASNVFTLGTVAVLPFYTLMVVAPKAEITKKTMESTVPFAVFGLLYAYLLCFSWTPDTMHLMFASKYWLPELPGIALMFSSEVTLASAWIHLLVVDLFAARQVYQDGLENEIETRHSVSMCLLFCPIGIVSHVITKSLSSKADVKTGHNR